ncbi:hypothetical protein FHX42_002223 [Saccharopolyspora lacisalsi]|uniref:Nuclear transport factor 2 family protein n=1 Tax=Halosaccharopolyspora lacisalsi TaxID=1000566 RepID=A0A839DXC2_9PSEU|nr:nuclear transport factor 2 family protein [Halosaccharopolyspora lacisalsi]MBA8824876.1 hypothetical protein [Halosaccharopolyspora lacisalsi]
MADIDIPSSIDGFVPSEDDIAGVHEWFARYDELAANAEVGRMADMAMFPLNAVTDDAQGNGSARQYDRERFCAEMAETVGEGASMESTRTPHFLSPSLVFVITDATVTHDGRTYQLRYADLLVKRDGQWLFQTMVQGGWG